MNIRIRGYSLERIFTVKSLAALLIAFMLTPLLLTVHAMLQERYSQAVIEDHLFSRDGYRITGQQQSVKLDFRIDPAYIPKKQGDVFELHKLIYNRNHTKIYLETVAWYNPPQNSDNIYIALKLDPTYLYGKGSFVTDAIFHDDHSFSSVLFMPDYYADNGAKLPINDGNGRNSAFIPVEQLGDLDGGLTLRFEGFNLVKYERE